MIRRLGGGILRVPIVIWYSMGVSALLVLLPLDPWTAEDDSFLPSAPEILAGLLFFAGLIWGAIYALVSLKRRPLQAALPLVIQGFTIWLLATVPFTSIKLDLDFRCNLKAREKIVAMVQSGVLKTRTAYSRDLIRLPPGYEHLSKGGGEVVVNDPDHPTMVLFFTFRGWTDNFAGFIYTAEDNPPHSMLGGEFKELEKKQPHWYWGSYWH
jgi:hypothetical protein